jgi:hypothetical protein
MRLTRRKLLEAFLVATAGISIRPARTRASVPRRAKRLIVFTLTGGASFANSFLCRRRSEVAHPERLDVFDEDEVVEFADSPLRAVRLSDRTLGAEGFRQQLVIDRDAQVRFMTKRRHQLTVATVTAGSITHPIGQHRAMTGGGAWRGRTIAEAFAAGSASAENVAIPNVNMASAGFQQAGTDPSLDARVRQESIVAPSEWFLGLHGSRGIRGAPRSELIDLARRTRDERLEPLSEFVRDHATTKALSSWALRRGRAQHELEALDLITKLCFTEGSGVGSLSDYGLSASPEAGSVRHAFPRWAHDPLESQAALAFLLLRHRVSAAVTIGPGYETVVLPSGEVLNPSVSFDSAHTRSRPVHAAMWGRVLGVADRLIDLMEQTVVDSATGETLWDDCVMYFVGEFGRETTRPDDALVFGTAHHPRSAILLASPILTGNRLLGGVDPNDLGTYGFDLANGSPMPETMVREDQMFAGVLTALGIDLSSSSLSPVAALASLG